MKIKTNLFKNKQRGSSTIDVMITLTVVGAMLMFVILKAPDIRNSMRIAAFTNDASTISDGVFRWKKGRSNYAGVTLKKLCDQNILKNKGSICGLNNDGKGTNPFGGDWIAKPNSNPGLYEVAATLPNNPESISELGDAMAPSTRGSCQEAAGCSTLTASGTTITMVY